MQTTEKSKLMRDAHALFMSGHYTQIEIANRVGITRRTLYNWMQEGQWQRARQNAIIAPTIITENFISAIIELQTAISQRPVGLRYPTPQETNTLSKLLACISRMSAFPTEALQQAALTHLNPAEEALPDAQNNFTNSFMPYHTASNAQQDNQSTMVTMGNQSSQILDNQSAESVLQVEKMVQPEPEHVTASTLDAPQNQIPRNAEGLNPEERKMAISKWFINRNLYPMGQLKVCNPDGSIDRKVTTDEMQYLYGCGYTTNDIHAALNFGLRA